MNGFASIDYDEPKGSTYRGIELHIGEKLVRYDTGDPVVDFCDYMNGIVDHNLDRVNCSSSFDHWFMDGASHKGKKVVVLYFDPKTNETVKNFDMDTLMKLDEYFRLWAYKGMKTLEDVKNYVREKKGIEKKVAKTSSKSKARQPSKKSKA